MAALTPRRRVPKHSASFMASSSTSFRRRTSIGKTPTIKQQARALDSDVLFILDADTVLESNNYIERTVRELYQAVGIASACGTILPLRERDRRAADESAAVQAFVEAFRRTDRPPRRAGCAGSPRGRPTCTARCSTFSCNASSIAGRWRSSGPSCNPVGCAVAYRREYLEALFDHFEPRLGDDLTNSEDIFIGLAMLNEGYRNIQLADVCARTVEPEVQRLPRQVYLWSSAFLQSAFYFDALLKSPFKVLKRWRLKRRPQRRIGRRRPSRQLCRQASVAYAGMSGASPQAFLSVATDIASALPGTWGTRATAGSASTQSAASERRRIQEPYRQAFGREHTRTYGRPAGWALMSSAVEKIGFPTVLLMTVLFGNWEGLLITIAAETLITVTALVVVMKNQRLEYLVKGIAVTPIRYALVASELVTIARFASDMWVTKNRRWRK